MSFRSDTIYISSDTDIGNGVCIEDQGNGVFFTPVNESVTLKKSPGQYFDGSETDLSKICGRLDQRNNGRSYCKYVILIKKGKD